MIETIRSWWNTRTTREKRLLLAAGGLAAAVLAWLLIVRPVDLTLEREKARHDRAVIALAQVEARIAAIEELRASGVARPAGSVRDIVAAEAARAGFTVTQTENVGTDGVRVIIGAVRPQSFFAWVADLEQRLGLDVAALTARPNSDQTLAVDVTFRGGR
jgi:general secretion pathway protein M